MGFLSLVRNLNLDFCRKNFFFDLFQRNYNGSNTSIIHRKNTNHFNENISFYSYIICIQISFFFVDSELDL